MGNEMTYQVERKDCDRILDDIEKLVQDPLNKSNVKKLLSRQISKYPKGLLE